jgi:EmrB/QacA subfamily drug resistance transporter
VADENQKLDPTTKLALFALGLGVFVIANDFTALSVAIPQIERDLHTSLTDAQWVINGYALVFGVLIVTGGRLADLFGRKRVFMIGTAIFASFSLIAGLMPNVTGLIFCRGAMGIGGALMWPAILGMIYALLPADKAGLAGGLLLGVAGLGNAVGPLLGGVLTSALSWRWIFFLNLPIAAFAVYVTWRHVQESRGDSTVHGMDYRGIAVLTIGVIAILFALDEGTDSGFAQVEIIALFVIGLAALLAFLPLEGRRGERALVPRDVLQNQVFAAASLAVLLMSAIFFAALLYLPQFMEKTLGYSALGSGVGLLPMMTVFAAVSFVAGGLYDRLGARAVVLSGAVALVIGMLLLSLLDASSTYGVLIPGMIVLGIGVGLFYSSITTTAVTALDPARASLAGGIIYMCQIAGGAVGLGLNTAIVASQSSLTDGISLAFRVDAVFAIVGFLVVARYVHGASTPEEDAAKRKTSRWHHRAHVG